MTVMKNQISIALAAGLLLVGVSAAYTTEMRQQIAAKMSPHGTYARDTYTSHRSNSKGQQHAGFTVSRDRQWQNVDID
jgi:hypothetical protein